MSVSETVVRQSSSYRQGLVLGLTMAEVILLIVFALLIALAAVWRTEHEEKIQLQEKLNALETTGSSPTENAADSALFARVRELLRSGKRRDIENALDLTTSALLMPELTAAEVQHISEIKKQMGALNPTDIDRDWRELVAAASIKGLAQKLEIVKAVERVAPAETDATKITVWIELGKQAQKTGEHDWPPIINLRETEGFTFATGRADLTPSFERRLKSEIVPQLLEFTARYSVDVIEIIGHTDEQAIVQRPSNLDSLLLTALRGTGTVSSLIPADNAGLGLSRAVSIVRALLLDGRLPQPKYRILPLSGGQLIGNDERVTPGGGGDVASRRRIEIRLRRSQESLGRAIDVVPPVQRPSYRVDQNGRK
jgi:outer membrane protein OmpA-like peptidoglycan-associated protein